MTDDLLRNIVRTEVEAVVRKHGQPNRLLTLPETAERLRVSLRTIHKLKRTGQLRPIHIGRRTLIPEREVDAYVAAAYRRSA
jgi:excisionase family DNA binding protein